MTDVIVAPDAAPADGKPRKGKLGLVLGLALAAALGGGGFYAVWSGLFDPGALFRHDAPSPHAAALSDVAFVPIDPVMISLPPGGSARLLRFTGQLEVAPERAAEVALLMPRVLDVLNGYLRAVEVADLQSPAALPRLRAQMLRRVQVVTGDGMVRDLLVTEFVLN